MPNFPERQWAPLWGLFRWRTLLQIIHIHDYFLADVNAQRSLRHSNSRRACQVRICRPLFIRRRLSHCRFLLPRCLATITGPEAVGSDMMQQQAIGAKCCHELEKICRGPEQPAVEHFQLGFKRRQIRERQMISTQWYKGLDAPGISGLHQSTLIHMRSARLGEKSVVGQACIIAGQHLYSTYQPVLNMREMRQLDVYIHS
jgi:hypothetical protein